MEGLDKYKSKLKALGVLVEKMENGTLSIAELSDLEELTRELHERSIILKYKAFEEKVGTTAVQESVQESIEESVEEKVVEAKEEVTEEVEEENDELEFSLFEDNNVEEQKAEEVPVEEKEPEVNEPPEVEPPREDINLSEPIALENVAKGTFLDRLKTLPQSVSTQFSESKIDTLNGAFGLNEKLRFVQELFDGSSDLFSEAITALDSQSSMDAASIKVEELAFSNSWDLEEEAVLEFMTIIKRRYA